MSLGSSAWLPGHHRAPLLLSTVTSSSLWPWDPHPLGPVPVLGRTWLRASLALQLRLPAGCLLPLTG